MSKTIAVIGLSALGMLVLSACGGAAQGGTETAWQDQVRGAVEAEMAELPDEERLDACAAFEVLGLDTAEDVLSLAGDEEYDVSDYAVDIPAGSEREAALIVAQVIIDGCDL